MRAAFSDLLASLADSPLARRLLDVIFSARARLHLSWLDRVRPDRAQLHALRRLVRTHARTDFARAHDFARIRDEADYRRLVPLRRPGPVTPSADTLATHRRAMRSALALCVHGGPRHLRLLTRPVVWLGEASARASCLPWLVRGLSDTSLVVGAGCLIGPASKVAPWAWSADSCISWDDGTPATGIELIVRPEGSVAVSDPRHGRFRLLTDHGAYYEFIPFDDFGAARPRRLGVGQTRPGEPYELVVSTPGAWATRTGLGVAFDGPAPLFRRVPLPVSAPAEKPSRPRTAGTPAALPGTPSHTPWSARADRG
ncbi:MAG: GH3 family domain-containing protein [Gemmataceae bacterium]